jgi:hypothetical protein
LIATRSYWRTKGEYATLLHVVLRTCTVAIKDLRDVEHSTEVTAETLYEAIATALAILRQDNWVGEIGPGIHDGDCCCPAAAHKTRSQNERFCLMARTPRTFARRSHAEAKAGENIGQGKRREDVTEKAKETDQKKQISEVSLTRSSSRFVGVLRLPRLRTTHFHR